ncbi:isoprenyl transferase [Aeoliella mucimassa]|uniref:Isoprenyl transferase n=1 Tax=Aeoliella mucimassa TaxID=2527972 RepID=A0A518ASR7_9BACT|nr:isoprenyl transferase [Aeoliella mucimassa]QDU57736.1 Decaprenyl diphosphate synthase-like protein [Aeoliella mucimassa]
MANAPDTPPLADVPPERRPAHIAMIMDGNGRWAQRRGLPRVEGHQRGASVVREVTELCSDLGIGQITLYCLSSENWKRPAEEIEFLMLLLKQYIIDERESIMRNNLRVRMLGRREAIPDHVLAELDKTIEMSRSNSGMWLNLAINYGGRGELVDATRALAAKVRQGLLEPEDITEETISGHLYTAGLADPDLLVRTAGEMRVSNFLLWQISYAEIWVTDRCWPEFDEEALHEAIRAYASRDRRFGGLPDLA